MGILWISGLFTLFVTQLYWGNALRPESELSSSCYDFPNQDYSQTNCIENKFGTTPKVQVEPGSKAVEFTLSNAKVSISKVPVKLLLFS